MAQNQNPINSNNINDAEAYLKAMLDIADVSRSITDEFRNALKVSGLGKTTQAEILGLSKKISKTLLEQADNIERALEGKMSTKDIQKDILKNEEQITRTQKEQGILTEKLKELEQDRQNAANANNDKLFDQLSDQIKNYEKINKKLSEQSKLNAENITQNKEALGLAKNQEKALGLTGAVLKGIDKSMDKLGLGALSSKMGFEEASKAAKEMALKVTDGGKKAATAADRAKIIGAAVSSIFKSLKNNLFSLESIITFIVSGLIKGSQSIADFRKETGMAYSSAYALRGEMSAIALLSNDNYITSEKLAKAYSSMTQQLGFAADVLGGEALVSSTNLEQRLGLSADQTATIVGNTRLQSKNTEDVLSNSIKTVGAFNKQNKTALNVKEVLKESANASKGLQATLGFSTTSLIKAAAEAKRLGLNLKEVESIGDSLLNFESSIQAELEAELLTGRQINLEKERLLALNGDMEGLAKSLSDNAAIQNAFEGKNVIQQEALAKAVGLTRDQLAQVALQQKFNNLSAEEFKDRYGETTYESLKARSSTEKFQDALTKITSILGDILALFSPILDVIALITDNTIILGATLGVIALMTLPKIVGGISSAFKGMKDLVGASASFLKNLGKSSQFAGGSFSKGKDILAGKADKVGDLTNKTKGMTNQAGKSVKNFLTSLGQGLKAFGKAASSSYFWMAIAGIAALGASLIPLGYALSLTAPAIEAFGKAIKSTLEGVGAIITSVADGFTKFLGALTLEGVVAIAALGPALISLGTGLSLMGASLLLGGGAAIIALMSLASTAEPMKILADSVSLLASSLKLLNVELKALDETKLDTLSDFAKETAGPMVKTAGGISGIVGGGSSKELSEIRDILNQILTKTGNVYLDSNKVGTTQIIGTYRVD
jgi:hypothetical protein